MIKNENNIIKILNIETDSLTVNEALAKVEMEISTLSFDANAKILKVIHGYGSSGSGGAIRNNLPNLLSSLKKQNKIVDFILNSKLATTSTKYKNYCKKFPIILLDKDLQNLNPGITLVFLKKDD